MRLYRFDFPSRVATVEFARAAKLEQARGADIDSVSRGYHIVNVVTSPRTAKLLAGYAWRYGGRRREVQYESLPKGRPFELVENPLNQPTATLTTFGELLLGAASVALLGVGAVLIYRASAAPAS